VKRFFIDSDMTRDLGRTRVLRVVFSGHPTTLGLVAPAVSPSATQVDEPTGGIHGVGNDADAAVRNPQWFLEKGDALIHESSLVAGLVGSEWRTRRPSRVTNQLPRRYCK
jgi:hypothetical protein